MMKKLRKSNKWLAALQPVLPHWKRMQRPSPAEVARQDLGKNSDTVMAPQPLGPMDQDHLMTIEVRSVDLIRSLAQKMNTRDVPSCYDSLASSTTEGLRSGSILFGKNPTCQPTRDLVTIHCKADSTSVRLVSESRAKSNDFVVR